MAPWGWELLFAGPKPDQKSGAALATERAKAGRAPRAMRVMDWTVLTKAVMAGLPKSLWRPVAGPV